MSVGAIISFSTLERAFAVPLLREVSRFASSVVVSYADKLYDGTPEDVGFVEGTLAPAFPYVRFVRYEVDLATRPDQMRGVVRRPTAYWHNLARWTAIQALDPDVRWVYVLDADEIPDGAAVRRWLAARLPTAGPEVCFKQSCYWYYRRPTQRARALEDSILLIHRTHLRLDTVFHDMERDGLVATSGATPERNVRGTDGTPMWHHYSFVRSRPGLVRKLTSWAHRDDLFAGRSAEELVEQMYGDAAGTDIVHGYEYETVEDRFGLGQSFP